MPMTAEAMTLQEQGKTLLGCSAYYHVMSFANDSPEFKTGMQSSGKVAKEFGQLHYIVTGTSMTQKKFDDLIAVKFEQLKYAVNDMVEQRSDAEIALDVVSDELIDCFNWSRKISRVAPERKQQFDQSVQRQDAQTVKRFLETAFSFESQFGSMVGQSEGEQIGELFGSAMIHWHHAGYPDPISKKRRLMEEMKDMLQSRIR